MTENPHDAESFDLRELLTPVWRRKWLIIAVVAIATVGTYTYNERKPDQFTASTRVFLKTSEIDQSLFGGTTGYVDPNRNLVNQAALLRTPAVARVVAKRIGAGTNPDALLGSISVAPSDDSDFLSITAVASTGQQAAVVANGFASAFIDLRTTKLRNDVRDALRTARNQLERVSATDATRDLRADLRSRISSLEGIDSLAAGGAEQIDKALPPAVRSTPEPKRAAVFAFALSLVFALLGAVGLERLDRRIRSLSQVGPAYHASVVAALPHVARSTLAHKKDQAITIVPEFHEAVRGLRTNLRLAMIDEPLRTIVVTSAVPSEGKSTLVTNLALAYEEAGLRVAVIECDLRRPVLAAAFGLRSGPGLTEVLAGEVELADAVQVAQIGAKSAQAVTVPASETGGSQWSRTPGSLTVLTSGGQPPDPTSVLATNRMREVLAQAREVTDIVIIDTPPLLAVADGLPLLGIVDGTLVVARIGQANRSGGRRVREIIGRVPGAEILGVVVNDVPDADLGSGGYGYGYGYGYPSSNGHEPDQRN